MESKYQLAETQHRRQMKALKSELQSTKLELSKHRQVLLSKPKAGMMEEFFVRCVDSVKKDISRRKHQAEVLPTLNDFSHSDRAQVITQLLSHDEVLSFIYDHLFPKQQGQVIPESVKDIAVGSARSAVKIVKKDFPTSSRNNPPEKGSTMMVLDEDTKGFLAQSKEEYI